MAKRSGSKRSAALETKLERVAALRRSGSAEGAEELRALLTESEPYLVARVADAIRELELGKLGPDLAAAFGRLASGAQPDARCMAITKVVEALAQLEVWEPDVYRAGIRIAAKDPLGDPGVPVRIQSAAGFARCGYPQALLEIAPLLADPESGVRAGVARVIGDLGSEAAAAVLHLKLSLGDDDPEVLGACMSGLLYALPERFLPIVGGYLGDVRLAELAAIALGDSRRAEAFSLLRDALLGRRAGRVTEAILVSLALLRRDEATEHLLHVLETGAEPVAEQALGALAVFSHDESIAGRVRRIAGERGAGIGKVLAEKFGR